MPRITVERKTPIGGGVQKIEKQVFELPHSIVYNSKVMNFDSYHAGYFDSQGNFLSAFDYVAELLGEKVEQPETEQTEEEK